MKNTFKILFLSLLFVACQQKIKPQDVVKLNGYWEIEKVVFDQGKDKDYKMNESYDFFQIGKNNTGMRNKVMPQLDGSFLVTGDYENVTVRFKDDKAYIDYSTPFSKWTEELVSLKDDELVLLNSEKKEYHYKKAGPINILGDGKKVK